jgi:hypothetical protein
MSIATEPTTSTEQVLVNEVRAEVRAGIAAEHKSIEALLLGKTNETEVIELDGANVSVAYLRKKLKKLEEQLHVYTLEDQQRAVDYGAKNLVTFTNAFGDPVLRPANKPNPKLLDTAEKLQEMFGQRALSQLSPRERAQASLLRESDVEGITITEYFGPTSSSVKATELYRENKPLYKALQARARKINLC